MIKPYSELLPTYKKVLKDARVYGNTEVYGNAKVCGEVHTKSTFDKQDQIVMIGSLLSLVCLIAILYFTR